jgi:outer membrane protein OmpA-like peptidoglycan-associated protein
LGVAPSLIGYVSFHAALGPIVDASVASRAMPDAGELRLSEERLEEWRSGQYLKELKQRVYDDSIALRLQLFDAGVTQNQLCAKFKLKDLPCNSQIEATIGIHPLVNERLDALTIQFARNAAEAGPEGIEKLKAVRKLLAENTKVRLVEVRGHTDDEGGDEENLSLSKRRAETARDHLVSRGIAADRLVAVGFGKYVPREPGDTEEVRRRNRRVEFRAVR